MQLYFLILSETFRGPTHVLGTENKLFACDVFFKARLPAAVRERSSCDETADMTFFLLVTIEQSFLPI